MPGSYLGQIWDVQVIGNTGPLLDSDLYPKSCFCYIFEMTTFQFLDNILERIKDRGLGMVSKALKLIFTFKIGVLETQKLGFWTVRGSFLAQSNKIRQLQGVSWFLSYILETVGDRGLGMVLKVLKLNFLFEMGLLEAQKLGFWTVWTSFLAQLGQI